MILVAVLLLLVKIVVVVLTIVAVFAITFFVGGDKDKLLADTDIIAVVFAVIGDVSVPVAVVVIILLWQTFFLILAVVMKC